MKKLLMVTGAILLAAPFAALAADPDVDQPTTPAATVEGEPPCDVCADYTDAAVEAGAVRSAYRAGTGYVGEPQVAQSTRPVAAAPQD